ncbi:F-box only protein 36 isoform X1 [Sarcophilus harrisii]|uniref:F-box only protein 36 isoform X1 n=1 Tax=Sarcophilus harrisii TaxID=9305 RepID=UPI001301ED25|nr:F-box only protein 36 isoform X1 [Sarcophilus harrisii]
MGSSLRVSLRWWRISLRNDYRLNKPGVTKEGYEDFLDDVNLHVQIALVFGSKVLQYVINLCKGKYDFLERLSDPLLLRIISYLDLEDIARLSQTSHRFQKNESTMLRLLRYLAVRMEINGHYEQKEPNLFFAQSDSELWLF